MREGSAEPSLQDTGHKVPGNSPSYSRSMSWQGRVPRAMAEGPPFISEGGTTHRYRPRGPKTTEAAGETLPFRGQEPPPVPVGIWTAFPIKIPHEVGRSWSPSAGRTGSFTGPGRCRATALIGTVGVVHTSLLGVKSYD